MPKYVVDPESKYKKGTVGEKRVSLTTPVDLTKDEIKRLEEVEVTVVEYTDKPSAGGNTGNNN